MTPGEMRDLDAKRFRLLEMAVEKNDHDPRKMFDPLELGRELSLTTGETDKIVAYLHDKGLIERRNRFARITHAGLHEVEVAITKPDMPTEHFPANVIHIHGNVTNSQLQQASPGASQALHVESGRAADLIEVLAEIKSAIEQLGLDQARRAELEADIGSAEAQLKSPKPKGSIVSECLKSIRGVLEGAAGGVASTLITKLAGLS